MLRTTIVISVVCLATTGCQALAEMQQQQQAQQQAIVDSLQTRIDALTPEQKATVQQCSALAGGRLNALHEAAQSANVANMTGRARMNSMAAEQAANSLMGTPDDANEYAVVNACLDNPYYYETIPAPSNGDAGASQSSSNQDGGLSSYQQCLAAQAAGAATC